MKNIFDAVKSGNLGNLGDIGSNINSALGGAGASVKNAAGSMGGMGGLLGSAAVGGLMGALFSGKKSKKIAKKALVVGGTAAAGALAWSFYQKWANNNQQQSQPTQATPQSQPAQVAQPVQTAPEAQPLPQAQNTAIILLEAMVFAARADGHIDEEEKQNIHNATAALFPNQEMVGLLDELLQKPIDPNSLAAKIQNKEEAHDLYRLSCVVIDIDSFMERSYLDGLAKALNLSEAEKAGLEQEALAARENMCG